MREEVGADYDKELQIADLAGRTTLDIIGLTGMDCDFHTLQDPGNELHHQYHSITGGDRPWSAKLLFLLGMVTSAHRLMMKVPTKFNRQLLGASAVIRGVARQVIRQKKEKLEAREQEGYNVDIVSVALGSGVFTEDNLVDQMMTFLGAGHETTSAALQWAVYYLSRYQDVQARLRDEVRANLPPISPENAGEGSISAAAIDSLPYLNAVCNEVFRFRPPVRNLMRVSARDTMLVGVPIPKGTIIVFSPEIFNHEKSFWGADADEFNPDRWMRPGCANTGGAVSNYAMLTFIHGPRSCIGQGFAKSELACMIATLVGRFHIQANDAGTDTSYIDTGITIKPKDGALTHFTPLEGW